MVRTPSAATCAGTAEPARMADDVVTADALVRDRPLDLKRRPPALSKCGMCCKPFSKALPPTRDHVISLSLLSNPLPPNLPTWRVCSPCQQLASPAEDRLRGVIASAYSRHPEKVADVAARARRSTRPVIPDRMELRTTDAGLAVRAGLVDSNQGDIELVCGKMARGLFYWRHGVCQPPETPTFAAVPSPGFFTAVSEYFLREGHLPVQRLGWDVWWMTQSEPPGDGIWLFVVHGAVPVYVATGAAAAKGMVVPKAYPIVIKP